MNAMTSRWTTKSVIAAAFFVIFLLLQIGVPLVRLWAPRPARFAWHMFTTNPKRVRYTLQMNDGTSKAVDLGQYVGLSRGEVNLENALPAHLCRVVPDLAAVQITKADSKQSRVYRCR